MSEEEYNYKKAKIEEQISINEKLKCRFVVRRLQRDLDKLTEFYNKSNSISKQEQ